MSKTWVIDNEVDMVALGEAFGQAFTQQTKPHAQAFTVFLTGDLGAGKTTLTRGILRAFGHIGAVKSPTYTLVEPYEFNGRNVYHFDLYRLGDPEELEYIGIRDYFSSGSVCVVEWPARGAGVLPLADWEIAVSVLGTGRKIMLQANTRVGEDGLENLNLNP